MSNANFFSANARCDACLTYKPFKLFSYDNNMAAVGNKYCNDCYLEHPALTGAGFFWNDPENNKSARSIRSSISHAVKKPNTQKQSNTKSILGCDFEFFQKFLASQFSDGMSFDNHGLWHIDHKVPISWARNSAELLLLNHFTNFRPFWAKANIKKSNKLSACGFTQEQWYARNPLPITKLIN